MDPFSITIAAVGITGTAISGMSKLRETIAGLQDAQEDLDEIRAQLDHIRAPLETVQSIILDANESLNVATKEALAKTGMADAVNDCGKSCEDFNKRLQRWTRHSSEERLSLRDKMSVGLWNKERVRTFRTRVETCQRTVHFAISSTQLILQEQALRDGPGSELLSHRMQALELETQETLAMIRQEQEEGSQRRQMLSRDAEDDGDDDTEEQHTLAIKEVDEQIRLYDETQVSLGVVFAQLRAGRTHQEIGNVVTDQESMALVGLPERLVGKMDQRIGNVSTTNKSASLVGVFDQGVDMKDFFKR